jgi:hypothetical protein
VFSIDHAARNDVTRKFYTATVCRDGSECKWAIASPIGYRFEGGTGMPAIFTFTAPR